MKWKIETAERRWKSSEGTAEYYKGYSDHSWTAGSLAYKYRLWHKRIKKIKLANC